MFQDAESDIETAGWRLIPGIEATGCRSLSTDGSRECRAWNLQVFLLDSAQDDRPEDVFPFAGNVTRLPLRFCEMRILAVCGSLKAGSGNLALLRTAAELMPSGVDVVFFDGLGDLPHFNPDLDSNEGPESVARWRRALSESDAVLIACPEYGFSLPGVLKNAIDWVIQSGELEQKAVGITAATVAPERGRRGLQALRDTLSALSATIVGGEPIANGTARESQVRALAQALVDAAATARRG